MGIKNIEEIFRFFLIQKFQYLLLGRNRLNRTIHTVWLNSDSFLVSGFSSPLLSPTVCGADSWVWIPACPSFEVLSVFCQKCRSHEERR